MKESYAKELIREMKKDNRRITTMLFIIWIITFIALITKRRYYEFCSISFFLSFFCRFYDTFDPSDRVMRCAWRIK